MAHNHVYGICESKCKEDVYPKKRVDEMLNGNVTLDIIENTLVEAFEFSDGTEIACYGGNPLVFNRNETYDSDDQWVMLAGTVSKIYKTPRQFKKGDVVKVYTGSSDTGDLIQAYVCWLDELPETIDLEKDCAYEDAHAIAEDEAGVVVELTLTRDAFGYLLLKFTKDESELNEGTLSVKNAKYFTATNAKAQLKHYDTNLELEVEASGGVGQSTSGKTWEIDTGTYYGYTGEIFNDYANNIAADNYSHAEGYKTKALTSYSHAEGSETTASGTYSHAEGYKTVASDNGAHAEGDSTTASADDAHAEGYKTVAGGQASHAEGRQTHAIGDYSHAEGYGRNALPIEVNYSTPNDDILTAWNSKKFSLAKSEASHVEGEDCLALGYYSHAEGYRTKATGNGSHSEGQTTTASGSYSHAEGSSAKAEGSNSHAEGNYTVASGSCSHAEGENCTASGQDAHAEGYYCTASGQQSHAEGYYCKATNAYSHAEGYCTESKGYASHSEGYRTIAANVEGQHAMGKNNVEDTSGKYAFIIGNGKDANNRSNAFCIDWNGLIYVNGAEEGVDVSALTSVNVTALAETVASLTARIEALESGT